MIMRLLEGEVRTASMTACAPGPNLTTQASNFSFRSRSAEFAGICTASTPNWRKQSARIVLGVSLRSTKAMRAEAFLVWGMGAKAVPKAFSIVCRAEPASKPILSCNTGFGKGSLRVFHGTKVSLREWTDELLWSLEMTKGGRSIGRE